MSNVEQLEHTIDLCQQGQPLPWMELMLSVETKNNDILPFKLGRITQHVNDNLWRRMVVLKPRQSWVTTYFQAVAYAFACCIPNFKAGIVLHEDSAAELAFKRIHGFHDRMEEQCRPKLAYDRTDLMEFAVNKSMLFIGSSRSFDFGRATTLNMLILSEFGKWAENDARSAMDSALPALPTDGWGIVECTATEAGTRHHILYSRAKESKGPWRAVFAPWMWHEEYSLPEDHPFVLPEDKGKFIPTPEELEVKVNHNLSHDQIRWWRYKVREFTQAGEEEIFVPNYPFDDVSCWQSGQEAAFPVNELRRMFEECRSPLVTEESVLKWKLPDASTNYICFVDCAEGYGGDDQYATILSCITGEQVAAVDGGNNMPQDTFARICSDLGKEYHNMLIVPERNNAGLFMDTLKRLGYLNTYKHGDSPEAREGFPTTVATKPKMVAGMVSAIKSGEFRSYHEKVVRQLMEYRKLRDRNGLVVGWGAPTGRHDDAAEATMGANLIRMTMPQVDIHRVTRKPQLYSMESVTW